MTLNDLSPYLVFCGARGSSRKHESPGRRDAIASGGASAMSAERRRRGEPAFAGRSLRRAIDVRIQLLPGRWAAPDVRPIPINLNVAPAKRDRVGHERLKARRWPV
jgi:hypothetical protein